MKGAAIMKRELIHRYRNNLVALRERVGGEVNYVVESLHDDVNIDENASAAPVHMADVAEQAVDADVSVLQTERGILGEINAALERIAAGAFGKCASCGQAISSQRLKAIPYASLCAACAKATAQPEKESS